MPSALVIVLRPVLRGMRLLARVMGSLAGRARMAAEGVEMGRGVRIWGVPIVSRADRSTLRIGHDVVLCSRSEDTALGVAHAVVLRTLAEAAVLDIGDDTGLSGASICAARSVRIGRRCLIGADVLITDTDFHARHIAGRRHNARDADIAAAPVVIGDDVFIGARACILKGVTIGDGAIVGCAAVVTRDVAPGTIVAGNPAVPIASVAAADARDGD